jgi:hypothetical protein
MSPPFGTAEAVPSENVFGAAALLKPWPSRALSERQSVAYAKPTFSAAENP